MFIIKQLLRRLSSLNYGNYWDDYLHLILNYGNYWNDYLHSIIEIVETSLHEKTTFTQLFSIIKEKICEGSSHLAKYTCQ